MPGARRYPGRRVVSKPPPQSSFPFHPQTYSQRANAISTKASKARRSSVLRVLQADLIPDGTFRSQAVAGVPATRADCPVVRPCPHVRCRHHLFLEDAEHRAGRPGLSSVPRDSRGRTLHTTGEAGAARAGTTLRPSWLVVRGLEIEREVKVSVWVGPDGVELNETSEGTLGYWMARLHEDEPVLVFDDDTGQMVAKAHVKDGAVVLDRELPESTFLVVLTRVREVSSCALDLKGKHSNEQVGDAIGRHRTLAARIVKGALGKAIEVAAGMGMSADELLVGLRELGAG